MLNMRNTIWIFLFLFALVVIPFSTQAQTPQQTLNQYISDLQKNPNDNALREKIIKHVQTMKPKPEISEEARRHFVRGNTALKDAKDSTDYDRAITRYNDALLISPWWADPYFNMAKALERRERYDEAISALKLYMLAAPKAGDTRSAQDMIYALEDKKEKAQKEAAAKKQEEAKPDFSGVWGDANSEFCWRYTFLISGREIIMVEDFMGGLTKVWKGNLYGRNFEGSFPGDEVEGTPAQQFKGSLSTDNKTIKLSTIVDPEVATTEAKKKHAQANIQGFFQRFGQRPGWDIRTLIRESPCK